MSDQARVQLQIPLMYAFRDAHRAHDARIEEVEHKGGERVLTDRGRLRRRGANEEALKRNLGIDLVQLANTINLDAACNLDGLDYVKRSVLNYGVVDLSNLSDADDRLKNLPGQLKEALLNNEPRFVRETMHIEMSEVFDDVEQKLRFEIHAEMACRPVDIPLEFVAEIDVGSGRLKFSDLGGGL